MNVVQYTNAQAFCEKVLPHLMQHEAENNLMIGILLRLADGTGKWGDEPPVLCAIEEQGQVVAAALQTPPYNLQLTRMDEAMMTCLVEHLRVSSHVPPGVMGPETVAAGFVKYWTAGTPLRAVHEKGLGIYQLDKVIPPVHSAGSAEWATQEDAALLIEWIREFNNLTGADRRSAEEIVKEGLAQQRYWVWKTLHPVSLASYSGPTPNGMRIGSVYTPPEYRGKGYASTNVAALSQYLLDSGRQFCYLFTDLANPISNSIYQKIGYRLVCEFASYRFESTKE